jgi:hypothetical protein
MSTKSKQGRSAFHHGWSLLGAAFRALWFVARLAYQGLVLAAEGGFWLLHGVRRLAHLGTRAVKAAKVASAGVVYCPDGHAIPVGKGDRVHACDACGFRYRGSPLLCPNTECEAPIAAYVSCPTPGCGLSVASPFRSH